MLEDPAVSPKKELVPPVVLAVPALLPKKEFWIPVVLVMPALLPKKEFSLPVVFELPAPFPANVLRKPATLKTRLPPMLYCVEVLMLPVTSKRACGLVVPMPTLPEAERTKG